MWILRPLLALWLLLHPALATSELLSPSTGTAVSINIPPPSADLPSELLGPATGTAISNNIPPPSADLPSELLGPATGTAVSNNIIHPSFDLRSELLGAATGTAVSNNILPPSADFPSELFAGTAVSINIPPPSHDYPPMVLSISQDDVYVPPAESNDACTRPTGGTRHSKRAYCKGECGKCTYGHAAPIRTGGYFIGGEEGDNFKKLGCKHGDVPTKIEVWSERYINGIKITYPTEEIMVGQQRGEKDEFTFNADERITYMQFRTRIVESHYNRSPGHLMLRTNMNREFSVWSRHYIFHKKVKEVKLLLNRGGFGYTADHYTRDVKEYVLNQSEGYHYPAVQLDVRGGYLCGMEGIVNHDHIARLGFYFMDNIESVDLYDIQIDRKHARVSGQFAEITVDGTLYQSTNMMFTGTWSVDRTDTSTVTWNNKFTYGHNVGFSFPIPGPDVNIQFTHHFDHESSHTTSQAHGTTHSHSRNLAAPLQGMCWNAVDITMEKHYANDAPLTALMRVNFKNNGGFIIRHVKGSVSYYALDKIRVKSLAKKFSDVFKGKFDEHDVFAMEPPSPPWRKGKAKTNYLVKVKNAKIV